MEENSASATGWSTSSQPVPDGEPVSIRWQWPGGMFLLCLTNYVLRLLTLGIYHFWAKTQTRKRIWSGIRVNDEPLVYTGRGMELFLGFVIVAVFVLLPLLFIYLWMISLVDPTDPRGQLLALLTYAPAFLLFGFAFYRAQRYQRARTRWRGVRFSLEGSAKRYMWTYFWTTVLLPFTAGWIQPWRLTALQKQVTDHTMFGDRKMRFEAQAGPLYPTYAGFWFGVVAAGFLVLASVGGFAANLRITPGNLGGSQALVMFGLIYGGLIAGGLVYAVLSAWFRARMINHFAEHTHFEGGHFTGRVQARGLIWITATNFLLRMASVVVIGGLLAGTVFWMLPKGTLAVDSVLSPAQDQVRGLISVGIIILFLSAWSFFGPIVQARTTGYLVSKLGFEGSVPINQIAQSTGADVRTGEGMAEAFDIDVLG